MILIYSGMKIQDEPSIFIDRLNDFLEMIGEPDR